MMTTTATADSERHSQQFKAKVTKLSSSPMKNSVTLNLDKKPLPVPEGHNHSDADVFTHEFARNNVRSLIHSITQELKIKGVKTALVLLAFRPKTDDHKLSEFLATVIPNGTVPAKQTIIDKLVKNTDEFTLVAALKYLWARLPMNCVIGWDAYDSFKKLEERDNYPEKAFLEFMPQCLSSPSHASIVYDFLDLIVSFAANSKENQLSGRKIAKMAGIWAFHGPQDTIHSTKSRLDPTENTFVDGLRDWLPAADAMFHLLLSFLRSMLPEDRSTKLQLPRTLQALLASNLYPPPDLTYSSSTLVSVPLVTIKTNVMSGSPVEMLNRVPKELTFENPDMFEAKEDFALLKSLCRSDDNILNKLSVESRRIVEAMCQKPKDSALKPGWPEYTTPTKLREPQTEIIISRVSLDDYFIWSWLASMSFEETVTKKKLFGRALISEVVFDGFKKWIIVEEQNTYANVRNHQPPLPEKPKVRKVTQPHYTSMLDGIPQENPKAKKSSRPKKEKSLPVIQPLVSDKIAKQQRSDSSASKKFTGLLNPLKKLQQHHQEPLPAPVPQSRAPFVRESVYRPPERVEPLPEIETNQYRLSIPLDSFGFDTTDSSIPDQNQNGYGYDNYDQNQYQSLAPQSQSDYLNGYGQNAQYDQGYQGNTQDYNYWSSEPRRTLAPPQNNRNSSYEIEQVVASLDNNGMPAAPPQPYNEPGYRGSIENLSSMVDHMTLQVGEVENKLGNTPAPMWDVAVPLPQDSYAMQQDQRQITQENYQQQYGQTQYQEPVAQPQYQESAPRSEYEQPVPQQGYQDPPSQDQSKALESMINSGTQKPRRKPPTPVMDADTGSAAGSSIYGPTPTAMNTPAFTSEERQTGQLARIPGSEYPVDPNGYTRPEDVPQIQVPHPKRQSQEAQPVAYNDQQGQTIDGAEFYEQHQQQQVLPAHRQMSTVEYGEQYDRFQSETPMQEQNQRYSHATTAHESFYSTETLQRGETPYTDASEMKSPVETSPQKSAVISKRSSNKYPESIIDSYQMSNTSSPQRFSPHPSPERSNRQSMNAATAASMRASVALSISDASYIPEPEISEVPAPAPIPKSPLAQKRLPQSPGKYDDSDTSRRTIEPIPHLTSHANGSVDSLPTQASYMTSRQTPFQEEHQQSIPQMLPQEPESQQQQRPQRKAPSLSPVRDARSRAENLPPVQKGYTSQHLPQDAAPVQNGQYGPPPQEQIYQQGDPQQQQQQQHQYGSQLHEPPQSSPVRPSQGPAATPQRHPQQQGGSYGPSVSPVHQRQGGAIPSTTPSRPQNLAPPGSDPRGTSPANNTGSRGGSPYRQQGGAYPPPPPQDGFLNPGRPNGGPYAQRQRNGSVSSMPGPQNGARQQPPMHGRAPMSGQQDHYKNHSPARPGSAPGQPRGRSPQHGGPPQGYYPPPQQGHGPQQGWYPPPQGYPPQGYPPQGYQPQGYPPQGYPPQGYPPQGYPPHGYPQQGYPPQGGYYPPPQGYYPPGSGSISSKTGPKPSASDMALQNIPPGVGMNKLHHRPVNKTDKKNMRNALTQGDFGI